MASIQSANGACENETGPTFAGPVVLHRKNPTYEQEFGSFQLRNGDPTVEALVPAG